ncbi:MAG: peptidyl-prolyl cis-trans isomerase [Solirubrobacterales bacterium]
MTSSHRKGLIAFGAIFVVLFVWVAVADGLGRPSVPSEDVAVVSDISDGGGNISKAEYAVAFRQSWKRTGLAKAPKAGDAQYETARDGAMNDLLDEVWLTGEAEELGISATSREVRNELKTIKDTQFPNVKAYEKFLEDSGFNEQQVLDRVKLQVLSRKIEEDIRKGAGKPTEDDIQEYYDASVDQYTTPAESDIRLIVTSDKADTEAVQKALAKDDSDKAFASLAKEYSENPTKSDGGKTTATAGSYPEPAGSAIMEAKTGAVEGPIEVDGNSYFFRVIEAKPEEVRPLAEVRNEIEQQLVPTLEQQALTNFIQDYNAKWTSRTVCADGFVVARCSNYEGDGRNPAADPACFEADDGKQGKDGQEEPALACPAAVALATPIAPGANAEAGPFGQLTTQPLPQGPIPPAAQATEPPPAVPSFPTG